MKLPLRTSGLVLAALVLLVWASSALPAILIGPPPALPPSVSSDHGATQLSLLALTRFMGISILAAVAAAYGAAAFAPERQSGAMDQLVLTPLARGEIVAERVAPAAGLLVPALCAASAADFLLLPLAGSRTGQVPVGAMLLIAVTLAASAFSVVSFAFSLGFAASLRCTTTAGAQVWTAVLFTLTAATQLFTVFTALSSQRPEGPSQPLAISISWAIAGLQVLCTVYIMADCVMCFDDLALGTKR